MTAGQWPAQQSYIWLNVSSAPLRYVASTRSNDEVASLLNNQLQLGHISDASFHWVKHANHLANLSGYTC